MIFTQYAMSLIRLDINIVFFSFYRIFMLILFILILFLTLDHHHKCLAHAEIEHSFVIVIGSIEFNKIEKNIDILITTVVFFFFNN